MNLCLALLGVRVGPFFIFKTWLSAPCLCLCLAWRVTFYLIRLSPPRLFPPPPHCGVLMVVLSFRVEFTFNEGAMINCFWGTNGLLRWRGVKCWKTLIFILSLGLEFIAMWWPLHYTEVRDGTVKLV